MLASGSTTDLRRYNRDAVLRLIKERCEISRTEIAVHIGLTNAAVSRIIKELIDVGLVEEGERVALKGQSGRRQVALRLSERGAYVLGIAVTLNARDIVIGNGQSDILARVDCSDIPLDNPDKALHEFARRAKVLIKRSGIDRHRLLGGAASVAGRVDPVEGRIIGADPLDWDGQQVAAAFERLLNIPFVSEGRAAALLRLEHGRGQASGLNDILLINVGLRLGTAFMVDGHLLRGAENKTFMLGGFHLTPQRTLDDAASGFAILSRLASHGIDPNGTQDPGSHLRQIVDEGAMTHGSKVTQAFHKSGAALGKAISRLAPILLPQRVILAGFVVRQSAYLAGVKSEIADTGIHLQASRFTTAQSAIHLALDHHLFNERLDIERLIAA